jgi:hypothetical protein
MSRSESQEAVLFFSARGRIIKQMMYMEFEAVLDGVVGLEEFADQTVLALYIEVNDCLEINACVTFTVSFDEDGNADSQWNLPLRRMAYLSERTVPCRHYKVRVFTAQENTQSSYTDYLWSFEQLNSADRVLDSAATAVERNTLGLLGEKKVDEELSCEAHPPADTTPVPDVAVTTQYPSSTQSHSPSVPPSAHHYPQSGHQQSDHVFSNTGHSHNIPNVQHPMRPVGGGPGPFQSSTLTAIDVQALQAEIKQQYVNEMANFKISTERLVNELQLQIERLKGKLKSTLAESEAHREHIKEQSDEIRHLRGIIDEKMPRMKQKYKTETAQLKKRYRHQLESLIARYSDEQAGLTSTLSKQISEKDDALHNLSEELCALRRDKMRLMMNGADGFFQKIKESGLKVVAYHPGAGHLTIPIDDLNEYIQDTPAYVAKQCGVSTETYLEWKQHNESLSCTFPLNSEQSCPERLVPVTSPKQFVSGISDRCQKHRSMVSLSKMHHDNENENPSSQASSG